MSEPILICLLDWMDAGSLANKGLAAAAAGGGVFAGLLLPALCLLLPQPAASRPAAAVAAIRCLAVRRIAGSPCRCGSREAGRSTWAPVTRPQAFSKSVASDREHAASASHDGPGGRSMRKNRVQNGRGRKLVAGAMTAGLLASAGLASAGKAGAAEKSPPVNPRTVLAARATPGVQLIQTVYSAHLAVPKPVIDDNAIDNLFAAIETKAENGQISADDNSIANAIVTAIDADPLTYLKPTGEMRTKDAQITGLGTGWVVTPDGYMVTAAHVVNPGQDELKSQFAGGALDEFNKEDAQEIASTNDSLSGDQ